MSAPMPEQWIRDADLFVQYLDGTIVDTTICVCGCPRTLHEHYRVGTDCGSCGPNWCPRYRRDRNHQPIADSSPAPSPVPDHEGCAIEGILYGFLLMFAVGVLLGGCYLVATR